VNTSPAKFEENVAPYIPASTGSGHGSDRIKIKRGGPTTDNGSLVKGVPPRRRGELKARFGAGDRTSAHFIPVCPGWVAGAAREFSCGAVGPGVQTTLLLAGYCYRDCSHEGFATK